MGLDIGEKRIGIAISDSQGRVATPLKVLDAPPEFADGGTLSGIIAEYEVDAVVAGIPLSLDGSEGPQARRIRTLVQKLSVRIGMPIAFVDERLTSTEASRRMREAGADERSQRGSKDMIAASILLQVHLDAQLPSGAGAPEEFDDA